MPKPQPCPDPLPGQEVHLLTVRYTQGWARIEVPPLCAWGQRSTGAALPLGTHGFLSILQYGCDSTNLYTLKPSRLGVRLRVGVWVTPLPLPVRTRPQP